MPNEFALRPVNLQVKCMELRVIKDQPIATKVHDIESFCDFLVSLGYEEVEVVSNTSGFIV